MNPETTNNDNTETIELHLTEGQMRKIRKASKLKGIRIADFIEVAAISAAYVTCLEEYKELKKLLEL